MRARRRGGNAVFRLGVWAGALVAITASAQKGDPSGSTPPRERGEHVIAPDQEDVAARMTELGDSMPEGWAFRSASLERKRLEVRYRHQERGDTLVFTLVHPRDVPDAAGQQVRQTERFAILVPEGPEDAPVSAMASALEQRVRAEEGAWEWKQLDAPGDDGQGNDDKGTRTAGTDPGSSPDGSNDGCSVGWG